MTVDTRRRLVLPRYQSPTAGTGYSRGPLAASWAEENLITTKGPRAGKPLRYLAWQNWTINRLYEASAAGDYVNRVGVVGVGRQNGKGIVAQGLASEALFRGPPGSEVYSAAGDRQQAKIVFGEVRKQILASPRLAPLAKVYRDAIEVPSNGNVYRALSSESRLQQGLSPYFVVFDEVHVQRDDELWNAMFFGMAARPNAILLGITTAGEHEDSLLGGLYEHGVAVSEGEADDPTLFFAWWEPSMRTDPETGREVLCSIHDQEAWYEANPALAEGVLTEAEMNVAANRSRDAAFRRYRLDQWTSHSGARWMDMDAWDDCLRTGKDAKLAMKQKVVLAFDGSVDDDSTVLSVFRCDLRDPVLVKSWVWERQPEDPDDWKVPRDEVQVAVDDCFANYRVLAFGANPAYWRSEIQGWQEQYGTRTVLEWPITDTRLGRAATEVYKRVKESEFGHVGDPLIRRHMRNAVEKPTVGDHVSIRKSNRKSEHKIDGAVTVCIGVDLWTRYAKRDRTLRSA